MKYKALGFTLAEVLIVLTLIGILSAFTIPSFISNTQNMENKIKWRKEYSAISQVLLQVNTKNRKPITKLCASWDHDCFGHYFGQEFNAIKYCPAGQDIGTCWHKYDGSFRAMNGDPITDWSTDVSGVILADGTLIQFYYPSSTCTYTTDTSPTFPICATITFDVNGFKPPNVLGKDIFAAWIVKNAVKPSGTQGDGGENTCSNSSTGESCAAEYLYK